MWKIIAIGLMILFGYVYFTNGITIGGKSYNWDKDKPKVMRSIKKFTKKAIDFLIDLGDKVWNVIYNLLDGAIEILEKENNKVGRSNIPEVDKKESRRNSKHMVRRSNS